MTPKEEISEVIKNALRGLIILGKTGQNLLQPKLVEALNNAGHQADKEDCEIFLRPHMPVWRSKDTGEIEVTKARRKIDIVVRSNNHPIALIETESDLNDLRPTGITRRNGHYDVLSIARSKSGTHFESYKSLERMAAAAYYFHLQQMTQDLLPQELVARIESIHSDEPIDHNPAGIALILVTGSSRSRDEEILKARLSSLNGQLISVVSK